MASKNARLGEIQAGHMRLEYSIPIETTTYVIKENHSNISLLNGDHLYTSYRPSHVSHSDWLNHVAWSLKFMFPPLLRWIAHGANDKGRYANKSRPSHKRKGRFPFVYLAGPLHK